MACVLGIEQPCDECGLCGNSPTWRYKMAKCKYPNEICANMTVYHGVAYCDSVPCSLKDELPKQTNADKIRNLSDRELAEYCIAWDDHHGCYRTHNDNEFEKEDRKLAILDELEWLESECDVE